MGFLSDEEGQERTNLIKMAICVTMFNEEKKEIMDTLRGILHNVAYLNAEREPKYQINRDEFVVAIISDGYD